MLFGLMLISAQFELAGVYGALSGSVAHIQTSPPRLLALLIAMVGALSAFLTNDVVAVAMTPTVLAICLRRGIDPVPFLLGIAFAANAGSVATIVGSPQNMLIAERLDLSFGGYMVYAAVPALVSLAVVWAVLALSYRGRWTLHASVAPDAAKVPVDPTVDRWEAVKALLLLGLVIYAFVFTDWNRGLVAASAGTFMLFNAHFMSRGMLDRVDWNLLILFVGLFVVNGAMQQTGLPEQIVNDLKELGFNLRNSDVLFVVTSVLSDIVSNVPTAMLLLPYANEPHAGPLIALASGLASNLVVVGSLANIIVVDAANQRGIDISFGRFARSGVPVTLISLALAWGWVWLLI